MPHFKIGPTGNPIHVRKAKNPESLLQQSCVKWFRLQYPKHELRLFAIPNGGKRSKITAAIMKSEGVVPGVWDLFLAIPAHGYSGMFIEMKSMVGVLSRNQNDFYNANGNDYKMIVIKSLDKFISEINAYLN